MNKGLNRSLKWVVAAAIVAALPLTGAFAVKTTPATNKNTNVPAVPRAIPDLTPYHIYDPPRGALFDVSKFQLSGDMRVRPEVRANGCFGFGSSGGKCNSSRNQSSNSLIAQQLIRLGFNYNISPDVTFFVQAQVANTFGALDSGQGGPRVNPGSARTRFFLRQGYMLIRNFVLPNLSIKAGRQLLVWGNHRIFGHFDWSNIGFAFDGVQLRYNHKMFPVELGWFRVAEGDLGQNGGVASPANGSRSGKQDADIVFVRIPMKIAHMQIQPAFITEFGGAANESFGSSPSTGGQASNQTRSTVGGRVAGKWGMIDATGEGYYQFGQIGAGFQGRDLHISALAGHFDAGVTLPVPMHPRIGGEINYASGDGNANKCTGGNTPGSGCSGSANTFSQLFPTNHINWGYMDLMSWQNMFTVGGNIQMRPTANSHFEVAAHHMQLANSQDNWYRANQGIYIQSKAGNKSNDLGNELDVVYTLFFQGNKVGWQLGYGHFFAGSYIDKNLGPGANDQDWGYTQLWVNF